MNYFKAQDPRTDIKGIRVEVAFKEQVESELEKHKELMRWMFVQYCELVDYNKVYLNGGKIEEVKELIK